MICITPCGLWQRGLGRSTALLFLPIAELLAAKRRLAAHPDPHYHRFARVMQAIPGARTTCAGSNESNSVQLAHECPGCRSPCPCYLRDSPPPTRAAACSFGALRIARGGSPDGFDEWCSTGPERVWEFAPSVQRRACGPPCSPAGAILGARWRRRGGFAG